MHRRKLHQLVTILDSDIDDDNDNHLQYNCFPYEAAAMKKREENLQKIKEMGMYKYSLVCTIIHYTVKITYVYMHRVMYQQRLLVVIDHQHHLN